MTAFILLALQLATAPVSFEQAKVLADSYEASLSPSAKLALVKTQGGALGAAFEKCGSLAESPIKPFTVVAHVSEIGATDQTWLSGNSSLAQCVQRKLSTATFPANGGRSFYTSYEFTFEP
ncbi:hypothetical protein [Lysobacter solisilvae (ex Woo and Kim 2020)]|uniref:AgmX/PglI C-terminal domain-containing protein n=1 Tax=Agrilutibacter terrestris TaxID=2865112 RepID=A0A7H0G0L4_9GAMM|nr:hypothetical protein [Lysobacter terrestris]QNP41830.1 hypothetical protein H8B22_06405 [Lysobacter terrestris]